MKCETQASDGRPEGASMEIVPTQAGYDRWAEFYDGEDNPLVLLEEKHLAPLAGDVAGLAVADIGCGMTRTMKGSFFSFTFPASQRPISAANLVASFASTRGTRSSKAAARSRPRRISARKESSSVPPTRSKAFLACAALWPSAYPIASKSVFATAHHFLSAERIIDLMAMPSPGRGWVTGSMAKPIMRSRYSSDDASLRRYLWNLPSGAHRGFVCGGSGG